MCASAAVGGTALAGDMSIVRVVCCIVQEERQALVLCTIDAICSWDANRRRALVLPNPSFLTCFEHVVIERAITGMIRSLK